MKKYIKVVILIVFILAIGGLFIAKPNISKAQFNDPPAADISSVSPNPATNQITVVGTAVGGDTSQGQECQTSGGKKGPAEDEEALPINDTTLTYSFDGGLSISGPSATVTTTGVSQPCGSTKTFQLYQYAFNFTDSTNIARLSPGNHTLLVCLGGNICNAASFTTSNTTNSSSNNCSTVYISGFRPTISGSLSVSSNTITATGSYNSGLVMTGPYCYDSTPYYSSRPGIDTISYSTDTGKSGSAITQITTGGVNGYCASSSFGQPEQGTFSLSFNDNVSSVHNLTISIGNCASKTLTYGSSGGTIVVTSNNSQTSTPVSANWDIVAGSTDICGIGVTCSGTAQTYTNQSIGVTYTIVPTTPRPDLYALNSVKLISPAKNGNSFLALLKKILAPIAEAACPGHTWCVPNGTSQTLQSGGSTDTFNVQWDPIANIALSQSSLSLSSQAGSPTSGQIQVLNTGAPGSTLTWTTTSSAPSWLSVSPSSDSTGITNDSAGDYGSDNVTVNASGLAAGTYSGTVRFVGSSLYGQWYANAPSYIDLIVTLTVTPFQCPNGDAYVGSSCTPCSNGGCTGTGGSPTNPGGGLICNNGKGNPPRCDTYLQPTATLYATPSTVNQGQSTALTWGSTNATSCSAAGGFSTGGATSGTAQSIALTQNPAIFQVTCTGPGGSASANASVTVLSPNATISANPMRVQSGKTSLITWSASNVTSCQVTDSSGNKLASGNADHGNNFSKNSPYTATITNQSTFTIDCKTNGGPDVIDSVTVNIVPLFQEF
jgi:hypothetical protein